MIKSKLPKQCSGIVASFAAVLRKAAKDEEAAYKALQAARRDEDSRR